jgi:hypothetical protein
MLAIAVGAYTALEHNSDELLRRAKAACLGRGGHTAIVSARRHPDRVYCAHGARDGYPLP